jgi:trans-aconitate 3-methyltransferase
MRFPKYPSLTPVIGAYAHDPTQNLGAYWEQPGRSILDSHLQPIRLPSAAPWDPASRRHIFFSGKYANAEGEIAIETERLEAEGVKTELRDVIMKKWLDWKALDDYLRTWSCLHTFHSKHPEDKAAAGGDIVQRFVKTVQEGVKKAGDADAKGLDVEWPVSLIVVKKTL